MPYSWDEIKRAAERNEDKMLDTWLAAAEVKEGHVPGASYPLKATGPYLEVVGAVVVGLYAALMALMFNYLLFVWILHISFDY